MTVPYHTLLVTDTFKTEKQLYLNQSKHSKETFNSKYPDYVYRQRPDRSQRKRVPGANTNPLFDPETAHDAGYDFSPAHDFD
jgi:hypothetical protein